MNERPKKIVVTGGPGGGKTTALDLFQRELKTEVKIVPEAASLLFEYGLNREGDLGKVKLLQQSIYKMQINLEEIFHDMFPERLLICDRGTLDGLAYWPHGEEDYFAFIGSSFETELSRYDVVIFFQSAAEFGEDVKSNNPFRLENSAVAKELDERLKKVWERHPNFHYIPSTVSFMRKITHGLITIQDVLEHMKK